jgi:hypothetical protein
MMTVYTPFASGDYELCHPVNQDDFETINVQIKGEPRQATWKPIKMRLIKENEGRMLLPSDSPWLGSHALIFRPSVIEVLGSLLWEYGELLPLSCRDADVSIFNPSRILDAFDEAASSVLRFSSGRIMIVNRYVFRPEVISGVEIFKIPNLRVSPTFVSERFVERWNSGGLAGLGFKRV